MELKDKVVVITGATRGLGRTLVEGLINAGAKVIVSSENQIETESVAKDLDTFGFKADVTKEEDIKNLAEFAISQFGQIDIWVNNAGFWIPHVPAEDMDLKKVHAMIEVNLFGTIYGSKAALVQMKKQGEGTIINILSISALVGHPGSSGYCASKFAAAGFTKSLAEEVKSSNLKVIAIYPDRMKTHFFDEKLPEDINDYMEPADVADKIIDNLKKINPDSELIIRNS